MCYSPLTVEQTYSTKQEGAGAYGRHAARRPGTGSEPEQQRSILACRMNSAPAGNDQCIKGFRQIR
jgi:hypothetical protein